MSINFKLISPMSLYFELINLMSMNFVNKKISYFFPLRCFLMLLGVFCCFLVLFSAFCTYEILSQKSYFFFHLDVF